VTIHTLVETQTAGFGMANGKVVQRLVVAFDEDRPAVTVRLERINHPDPLDDRDPTERTLTELSVKPTDDVDEKVEIGTRHGQDRVRLASNDHAPRVYVRHERQDGGWSEQTAWELHPTTGITQVGGEVVADGGSESGTCESGNEQIRHRGGSPCKLRLTALEQDVLYHHLQETMDGAADTHEFVLDDILDKLPEEDILTRPPSVETLIEIGYFEEGLTDDFDAPIIAGGSADE